MSRPQILVILGPTASGKSGLAVRLAKKLNGEIISADSRQVYKGLDIGTGKITRAEMKGVRHHLLDVADPRRQFSVERYQRLAGEAIRDIASRGKLPIICGGTGFYIDAVVNGTRFPAVKADNQLRTRLSKKSAAQLFGILKKLDEKKAASLNDSDKHNPRRLIRAIEIVRATVPFEDSLLYSTKAAQKRHMTAVSPHENAYDVTFIGIDLLKKKLHARIHSRLMKRIRHGLVAEVRRLHAPRSAENPNRGLSWKRLDALGLEYRYVARYLQAKMTGEEMVATLETEIRQYAKRQMTWFRRNKKIRWSSTANIDFTNIRDILFIKRHRKDRK